MEQPLASENSQFRVDLEVNSTGNHTSPMQSLTERHKCFQKRSFTFPTFRKEIQRFYRHRKRMIDTFTSGRLSNAFIERIMMAITAVNGCIYCSYVHSRMALEAGCTEDELEQIMNFNYEGLAKQEVVALTFAQHYAETNRHPSKDAMRKLIAYYGPQKSRDIYHVISGIYFGNLMGNTIDAFESRIHGIPPKNGDWLFEFLVYIFGGFIFSKIMKRFQKKSL
jgi:AhpD family alkylhydroperoxidase